jgi:hypothetical protein
MTHIQHGNWQPYIPETPPEGAPPFALFCRRESDGVDWYEFQRSGVFQPDSVVFTAYEAAQGFTVAAATFDKTAIYPAHMSLVEIPDYEGDDPQAELGNKLYDPIAESFSDPAPPPPSPQQQILTALERINARLDKLEKR